MGKRKSSVKDDNTKAGKKKTKKIEREEQEIPPKAESSTQNSVSDVDNENSSEKEITETSFTQKCNPDENLKVVVQKLQNVETEVDDEKTNDQTEKSVEIEDESKVEPKEQAEQV